VTVINSEASPPDFSVEKHSKWRLNSMIARMIVTGLVALFLPAVPPTNIQQPQSARPQKTFRIFIEEDFSTTQMLKKELSDWAGRMGAAIIFVEKNVEPYDLRILLASDVGSGSDSCYSPCSTSFCEPSCMATSSSCSVTVTLYFVSALALTPDGKLQFTETGVGSAKRYAITPLARKLAKRLSVLPDTKATPEK
jgi:hypothetical protein